MSEWKIDLKKHWFACFGETQNLLKTLSDIWKEQAFLVVYIVGM
jgi:hypothetical protein